MFEQENRALARTTSGRSYFVDSLKPPNLDTLANAAEAARSAWWGAAWLAVGFAISLLVALVTPHYAGLLSVLRLTIIGVCLVAMVWFAWLLRQRSQPRWVIAIVLILLVLDLLAQLVTLHIGVFLIVNSWLIWVTFHALRASYRVAAYKRGLPSEKDLETIFG